MLFFLLAALALTIHACRELKLASRSARYYVTYFLVISLAVVLCVAYFPRSQTFSLTDWMPIFAPPGGGLVP